LKLTKQQWELIILGVVLVFGGGWVYWNYLYRPVVEEIKKSEEEIDEKRVRLERLKRIDEILREKKREFRAMQLELEVVKEMLPKEKEIPSLLQDITLNAISSGIDLRSFIPRELRKGEFYDEFSIQMEIKGTYHGIGRFLAMVGNLERVIIPSKIGLDVIEPTPEHPYTVRSSLTLFTYVYRK
jgi:type IV pilus assembly protein PilO